MRFYPPDGEPMPSAKARDLVETFYKIDLDPVDSRLTDSDRWALASRVDDLLEEYRALLREVIEANRHSIRDLETPITEDWERRARLLGA